MKQCKRTKQRLLSVLLCAVLSMSDISLAGSLASANEPETNTVKEDFYEDEKTTVSADMAETDESGENDGTQDIRQEESKLSETESTASEESSTTADADGEAETSASKIENEAAFLPEMELIEEKELTGVYQFGGAPSKENTQISEDTEVSLYSVPAARAYNTDEWQKYIYQQMMARNPDINMRQFNIAWIDREKVDGVIQGVFNEHPELYFVNKYFKYSGVSSAAGSFVATIKLTYDNAFDDNKFQNENKKALAAVKPGMSDLEKAIALHDYLVLNCEYDKENLDKNTVPPASYTAYGTLVERTAVCQGYALAYKYFLNQVGIECHMVTSSEMNHAWNLIKLNGKYYQADVTWDDPAWDLIGRVRHQYMFRSDNAFRDECEHYGWSVTKGNEVVNYQATDTSYDNAFWLKSDAPLVLAGEDCYYTDYDSEKSTGVIRKTTLSDITGTVESICDIGRWPVWEKAPYFYQNAYSGLFLADNRLYYNDKSSIYSIAIDSTQSGRDKRPEFTADTRGGIYTAVRFAREKCCILYIKRLR